MHLVCVCLTGRGEVGSAWLQRRPWVEGMPPSTRRVCPVMYLLHTTHACHPKAIDFGAQSCQAIVHAKEPPTDAVT